MRIRGVTSLLTEKRIPSFSLALFTLPLGELRERHYGTSKGGWTVGFSFEDVPLSARMADDGRAKRLKSSSQDGATVSAIAELRGRVTELESEIERLRSENAHFRQPGRRQEEGNHEVLPAVAVVEVAVTVTVDLSIVDKSLVTHISSFLGTSHELFSLALTCKAFGQPTSTLNLVVDGGGRTSNSAHEGH